jgi:DNA-binding CsgD family transcriptional regulator
MGRRANPSFVAELGVSADELEHALETVTAALLYVLHTAGRVRWINASAAALHQHALGHHYDRIVAPGALQIAHEHFARALSAPDTPIDFDSTLRARDGRTVPVTVSAAPLAVAGEIVGVFGVAVAATEFRHRDLADRWRPPRLGELTARQHEVLRLLGEGRGTSEIADLLHISAETVRNHVRAILFKLSARSRLEAVALARHHGVLRS